VTFALAVVLCVTKAGSPDLLHRTRPPSAVLRRPHCPGVLLLEFTVSSPSFWCDPRVKWGTLALHQPRAVARCPAPPRATARRRISATACACTASGPPDPQSMTQIRSQAGQTGPYRSTRLTAPTGDPSCRILIQRIRSAPPP
jgi:hypothetical protein